MISRLECTLAIDCGCIANLLFAFDCQFNTFVQSRHHTAVQWELRQGKTNTARNPLSRGEQWRKEHAGPSSSPSGPTQVQQEESR